MQPDLAPVMPAAPYEHVGRLSRLMAVVTLAGVPEWRRVRRAQAAVTPIDGPQAFIAVSPAYRTVAGRTIRIAEAGDPTKPTVVFLSPFPLTILTFEPVWRLLAELDLRDAYLVGHDIPSAIVLRAAAIDRSRIAGLVIGDGPGIDVQATDLRLNGSLVHRLLAWGAPYRTFVGRAGAPAVLWVIKRLAFVRARLSEIELADQLQAYRGKRIRSMMTWFAGSREAVRTHVDPLLATLDVPVHVVWGADDVIVLEEMGRELHRRLPRSRFTSIADAGHAPWADQPEIYADLVRCVATGAHRQEQPTG